MLNQDTFACSGTGCAVTDWIVGTTCDEANPCAGGGLRVGGNTLELCRSFDVSAFPTDVYVAFDAGENGADDPTS